MGWSCESKTSLPKYLGTEESDYIYEATRIMMMGAVQRVYNPDVSLNIWSV